MVAKMGLEVGMHGEKMERPNEFLKEETALITKND